MLGKSKISNEQSRSVQTLCGFVEAHLDQEVMRSEETGSLSVLFSRIEAAAMFKKPSNDSGIINFNYIWAIINMIKESKEGHVVVADLSTILPLDLCIAA